MSSCGPGMYVGATGRIFKAIGQTFTPDTTVFADSQGMTSDILAFDCSLIEPGRTGLIDEVVIRETASSGAPVKLPMRLIIAKAAPGVTAHTAYTVTAIQDILGVIDITSGDWIDLDGSHALARVKTHLNIAPGGTTIWVGLLAKGAGTYAATASVEIELRTISD